MMYLRLQAVLVLFSAYVCAHEPLPRSVAPLAVYYVKSEQLPDFSCAYNALFNACNVNQRCGIGTCFANYENFQQVSLSYARSNGLNPKGPTSTKYSDELALKVLGMKNICNLGFDEKGKIVPLFPLHANIRITGRESEAEKKRMFDREFDRQRESFFQSVRQQFDQAFGLKRVMHFICGVQEERGGHAVLISLIQNETGRGLYIFDNLNRPINEHSEIMRYIHSFIQRYEVSGRAEFRGPQLPTRWPTLPQPRHYYYY